MNTRNGRDMASPSLRSIDMPDTCDMETVREPITEQQRYGDGNGLIKRMTK
jgi:hypothetical protein